MAAHIGRSQQQCRASLPISPSVDAFGTQPLRDSAFASGSSAKDSSIRHCAIPDWSFTACCLLVRSTHTRPIAITGPPPPPDPTQLSTCPCLSSGHIRLYLLHFAHPVPLAATCSLPPDRSLPSCVPCSLTPPTPALSSPNVSCRARVRRQRHSLGRAELDDLS